MRAELHEARVKARRKRRVRRFVLYPLLSLCILISGAGVFLFATSQGHEFRRFLASTILSTQHRYLANYLGLSKEELNKLLDPILNPKYINVTSKTEVDALTKQVQQDNPGAVKEDLTIHIKSIKKQFSTHFFTGKLMIISNPLNVHLVTSTHIQTSKEGELIATMAKRVNAIGAINANGFYDPSGTGDGGIPLGMVIEKGKILSEANKYSYVTGLTDKGVMITGRYTPEELLSYGVVYAAGFRPQLIVNGKKMITSGDGGWGLGPRTAMGQTKDGSILFLVIDGRQPTLSLGASLKEIQDILYEEGAINAMCMDGGASSSMYFNGGLITSPATPSHIGRLVPDAWVVYANPGQKVQLYEDGKKITSP